MQEPLLSELGYLADTPAAEQILNGTYVCPPGTDNFMGFSCMYECSPSMGPADQISMVFIKDDFQVYWKSQRKELHLLCWPTRQSLQGCHVQDYSK
jgi:hypothetical protein